MTAIKVKITGIESTNRNLRNLSEIMITQVTGIGLRAAAAVVAEEAKRRVPIRTGMLQRSIRSEGLRGRVQTPRGLRSVPNARAAVSYTHLTLPTIYSV